MTEMTLLGYVTRKLLGPPTTGNSWPCPFCGGNHATFNVRYEDTPKPKFRCFRCNEWGDVFDLVKLFNPALDFEKRQQLVAQYQAEFNEAVAADALVLTPQGTGSKAERQLQQQVDTAFAYLSLPERCVMATAARIEHRLKLKPSPLSEYCLNFEFWYVLQTEVARAVEEQERQEAEEEAAFQQKVDRMRQKIFGKPAVNPAVRRNGKPH